MPLVSRMCIVFIISSISTLLHILIAITKFWYNKIFCQHLGVCYISAPLYIN